MADLAVYFAIMGLMASSFAVIILLIVWYDKKRREAFKTISRELGFSFEPYPKNDPYLEYNNFKLFHMGRNLGVKNFMKGRFQGIDFEVYDFHYTVGFGKNKQHYNQTIAVANFDDLDLPLFVLGPESFFSKVAKLFGKNDINFVSHKKFSDTFLLKGDDEMGIRQVFKTHVLDFFEDINKNINIEAEKGRIMVYKHNKTIKPKYLKNHLFEVATIVKIISDS